MKKILFVTSNDRKMGEARLGCEPYGVEIVQATYDIDEIQSDDALKVSDHKARAAFEIAKQPLVVTDSFFAIPALRGFPGAYMKEVDGWFTAQDFMNLMADKEDKRVMFSESITYIDSNETKIFSKQFWGLVVPPRGEGKVSEMIFEFDGSTIAEQRGRGSFSHKPEDYVWSDFAKWYAAL